MLPLLASSQTAMLKHTVFSKDYNKASVPFMEQWAKTGFKLVKIKNTHHWLDNFFRQSCRKSV